MIIPDRKPAESEGIGVDRIMVTSAVQPSDSKPFLKWPGGKRWLAGYILNLLDGYPFVTYFEPFLGGGALFFALQPKLAMLSDINPDLINTYIQVRYRPHLLIQRLQQLPVDKATYDRLRRDNPKRRLDRAIRFLYLNRTGFGGMYRLNRNGDFNVPYGGGGRTPAPLWEEKLLVSASRKLKSATLRCDDFETVLTEVRSGDLVYCDPTYTVAHNNNGFVRYNERNFSWDDQKRLANTCQKVIKQGATVLISSAVYDEALELYRFCEVHQLNRMSLVCPHPQNRRPTKELLFIGRPDERKHGNTLPSPPG